VAGTMGLQMIVVKTSVLPHFPLRPVKTFPLCRPDLHHISGSPASILLILRATYHYLTHSKTSLTTLSHRYQRYLPYLNSQTTCSLFDTRPCLQIMSEAPPIYSRLAFVDLRPAHFIPHGPISRDPHLDQYFPQSQRMSPTWLI